MTAAEDQGLWLCWRGLVRPVGSQYKAIHASHYISLALSAGHSSRTSSHPLFRCSYADDHANVCTWYGYGDPASSLQLPGHGIDFLSFDSWTWHTDCKGVPRSFYWRTRPKSRRPRGGGVLGEAATPSPPARGSGGAQWAPLSGFRAEHRPPKGFPLLSALRLASPDNIILLIVQPIIQPVG